MSNPEIVGMDVSLRSCDAKTVVETFLLLHENWARKPGDIPRVAAFEFVRPCRRLLEIMVEPTPQVKR